MGPSDYAMGLTRVELAGAGKASVPIVLAKNATIRVRNAAADLATYLGRMSGAEFVIRNGGGKNGIAVGLAVDFPSLNLGSAGEFLWFMESVLLCPEKNKDCRPLC